MKRIVTGTVQQQNTGNVEENIKKIEANIRELALGGATLVVLPELHNTLYFCQTENLDVFDYAEPIPGPSTQTYGRLAKELGIVLVTSLFEKRAPGLYHNTAVVFEKDGSIAGKYRKMHIPDDPGYYEKYYFTPGDMGFNPIKTSVGNLGLLVCWDQWFPEAARLMALKGAEVLIYPTAIGWDRADTKDEQARQLDAWVTIQRSHAIANGIPLIAVNRTGFEASPENSDEGADFWGNSFVCGPQGEFLTENPGVKELNLIANIDISRSEKVRQIWPYLRDRRIDAYGDLTKRFIDG
ncbi:MAG: carbon-nitrogen hydrolase [Bacteroidota bacterium]